MRNRWLAVVLVLASVAALGLAGCSRKTSNPPPPPSPDVASAHGEAPPGGQPGTTEPAPPAPGGMPSGAMSGMPMDAPPPGSTPTSAAGLGWSRPAAWTVEPASGMRVATYRVAPVGGDAEGATCAVYSFGPGQGGGVDANVTRWIGQFSPVKDQKRSTRTVDGVPVSIADVAGTYTAHGGSMGGPQTDQPGWRLVGAIAESPGGTVFFKLTGPEKTVAAAKGAFDGMIGSLKSQ
jgi:hypothetical protein